MYGHHALLSYIGQAGTKISRAMFATKEYEAFAAMGYEAFAPKADE